MAPRSEQLSEQMRFQSRSALISAARTLFAKQGFFNTKVSDIAREAGMSQGNVYWYFTSKEELLQAVLADGFETLGGYLEIAASGSGSSIQRLDDLIDRFCDFGQERGEFNQIVLSLIGQGGVALFQELGFDTSQIGFGYTQSLIAILSQGKDEGIIEAELDPYMLSMFFFALFNGLNLTYNQEWLGMGVENVREAVHRLLGIKLPLKPSL